MNETARQKRRWPKFAWRIGNMTSLGICTVYVGAYHPQYAYLVLVYAFSVIGLWSEQ